MRFLIAFLPTSVLTYCPAFQGWRRMKSRTTSSTLAQWRTISQPSRTGARPRRKFRRSRMLKGVIFDMDGVLIDSHPIHKRAWRKFFETLELTVSDRELDFVLDGRKKEDILRHFLGD